MRSSLGRLLLRRRRDASCWGTGYRGLLPLTLFQLESLMSLLPSTEFCCLQLLQMELLPFLNQLLPLVFQTFPLSLHRCFELFKVSQLDLQFFHLCFDQ